jgi:hypothetical protein
LGLLPMNVQVFDKGADFVDASFDLLLVLKVQKVRQHAPLLTGQPDQDVAVS